jgi:hypothetical protein
MTELGIDIAECRAGGVSTELYIWIFDFEMYLLPTQ